MVSALFVCLTGCASGKFEAEVMYRAISAC